MLEVKPWKVPFPKKKPLYPYIPPPSNKTMNVLHLSDWHIDPLYEVDYIKYQAFLSRYILIADIGRD